MAADGKLKLKCNSHSDTNAIVRRNNTYFVYFIDYDVKKKFLLLVLVLFLLHLRLVFTSNGLVVGIVIRRVERCDLVKIKPTESEAKH